MWISIAVLVLQSFLIGVKLDYVGNIQFNVTARNGEKLFYSHNVDRFSPSIAEFTSRSKANEVIKYELRIEAFREDVRVAEVAKYNLNTVVEAYDIGDVFFFPSRDTNNIIKALEKFAPSLGGIVSKFKKDGDYVQSNPRTDKKLSRKLRTMLPPKIPITVHKIMQSALRPFFDGLEQSIPTDVQTYVEEETDQDILVVTYFNFNLDGDDSWSQPSSMRIALEPSGLRITVQSNIESLQGLIEEANVRKTH